MKARKILLESEKMVCVQIKIQDPEGHWIEINEAN